MKRGNSIDPGRMDTPVTIESYAVTKHPDTNEPILTYNTVATAWAEMRWGQSLGISDDEKEILDRESVVLKYVATIRYNPVINDHQMRLLYEGNHYDIEAIREVGRRDYMMLYCVDIE